MLQAEIAVVGAGPAGLSAALEASSAGASVIVVDEYPRLGGQYFKQPPASFKVLNRSILGREYGRGQELMKRIEEGKVEVLSDTLVWGALEPGILEIYRHGECQRIRAGRIIVATGAYERPIAFPGWTLPGVMTAGAAQTMVKSQWVLPGSRILMVGAGPFQLPVASQLIKAGATLAGVLEATRFRGWIKQIPTAWGHLDKVREVQEYWTALLRARVPMMYGWTIIEARGKDAVEEAVIARVDDQWRPIAGTEKVLAVDTICLGFGFLPSLQVPRLLGCDSRWNGEMSAWVTSHNSDQRTSVAEVFVAGETTGIGGHDVAIGEGILAGVRAAADLGYRASEEAGKRLHKAVERLDRDREFAGFLNRTFALRPGIFELAREDTLICRCEEVTAGEIAAVAKEWDGSLRTIKQLTRVGMGLCQGRICGPLVAQIAARASGKTMEQVGQESLRPPIKPVSLGALATMPVD